MDRGPAVCGAKIIWPSLVLPQVSLPAPGLKAQSPDHAIPTEHDLQMNTWSTDAGPVQLSALVERLQREVVHVALIGHDSASVDEQGRRLVQSLRQDAGLEVLVLFDAQDDALLERVNQRLASLSLDQARQVGSAREPLQVWVLQVQSEAQVRQAQMLARMVRDLPAVHLRLIALMTPILSQALFDDPVGRSFVPWRLPGPALRELDEDELLQDPEPQSMALSPAPSNLDKVPPLRLSIMARLGGRLPARLRERLRHPPDPPTVAAIAVGLLLVSLLVSCI